MSVTAAQPFFELFAEQQPDSRARGYVAEPITEPGKNAGSKLYVNTARPEDAARRRFAGSGLTLEERISGVWEGLLRTGTAECPVCHGKLERAGDRGVCTSCGSQLA